jgi:hypothetical protein
VRRTDMVERCDRDGAPPHVHIAMLASTAGRPGRNLTVRDSSAGSNRPFFFVRGFVHCGSVYTSL